MNLRDNLTKIKNIGKGGFGKVILCKNFVLDKKEAVKICSDIT